MNLSETHWPKAQLCGTRFDVLLDLDRQAAQRFVDILDTGQLEPITTRWQYMEVCRMAVRFGSLSTTAVEQAFDRAVQPVVDRGAAAFEQTPAARRFVFQPRADDPRRRGRYHMYLEGQFFYPTAELPKPKELRHAFLKNLRDLVAAHAEECRTQFETSQVIKARPGPIRPQDFWAEHERRSRLGLLPGQSKAPG